MRGKSFTTLFLAGLVAIIGYFSLFQVYETEQAIVLQFGDPKRTVLTPGLKFKLPWQNVVTLDRRILNLDVQPEQVNAADQKRLVVDAFARFRIVDPLKAYLRATNETGARNRLETLVRSTTREVLARQTFANMLSPERGQLMLEIRDRANEAAADFGLSIVDVRIKRVDLPEENSQAIYRRMETERQQEAAQIRAEGDERALKIRSAADRDRTIILAEAEKQANILRGEGDGEAVRIFAEAFGKDEEFFSFYRSMQAYRKALGQSDTTMVLSPDSEFFEFFDAPKSDGKR
ncbi:MAG: protease modulator HflC [Sphingomonadales bacterium]|jgi:membrane protease subunit HflC